MAVFQGGLRMFVGFLMETDKQKNVFSIKINGKT